MAQTHDMPLTIRRPTGLVIINTAQEALDFLDTEWPADKGYLYDLARRRCEKSLIDPTLWKSAKLSIQAAISTVDMFPPGRDRKHPKHL